MLKSLWSMLNALLLVWKEREEERLSVENALQVNARICLVKIIRAEAITSSLS